MIKELFCNNLDLCLCNIKDLNPVCYVLTCDFNVRSSKWWNLNKNTPEGLDIGSSVSASGGNQIIDHITS